jgi:hypothetical protein
MKIKQVDETSARAINGRYGRPRAISRGHLGVIERIAQRAEAPGLAAKGITAFSRDQFSSTSISVLAKNE